MKRFDHSKCIVEKRLMEAFSVLSKPEAELSHDECHEWRTKLCWLDTASIHEILPQVLMDALNSMSGVPGESDFVECVIDYLDIGPYRDANRAHVDSVGQHPFDHLLTDFIASECQDGLIPAEEAKAVLHSILSSKSSAVADHAYLQERRTLFKTLDQTKRESVITWLMFMRQREELYFDIEEIDSAILGWLDLSAS